MTRTTAMSRLISTVVLLGTLTTVVLRGFGGDMRWWDRPAWLVALGARWYCWRRASA